MKRLGAITLKNRDKRAEDIRNATGEMNAAIDRYNEAMNAAKADIEAAQTKLNEAIDEARTWRDEIVSDMENYVSDRSDKWTESDAGQDYDAWKQEFENLELEDVEFEMPEELEHIEDNRSDAIENLPESPG